MGKTLKELADFVGGSVIGDGNAVIEKVSGIQEAGPDCITFISNPKYVRMLRETKAGAVIVSPQIKEAPTSLLVCRNPYLAFARIVEYLMYEAPVYKPGIDPQAHISESASIGRNVVAMPFAFVGENSSVGERTVLHPGASIGRYCRIGSDCVIHSNAVIYDDTVIGDRVTVNSNCSIGTFGFGYAPDPTAKPGEMWYKIRQVGRAVIEDDVDIGANSVVNRAAMGETCICRGAKIDSLTIIAHNCVIGEDTLIISQVGIAGSVKVGKRCTIASQVGIVGHIAIGDDIQIGAKSGINHSITEKGAYLGSPAIPAAEGLKSYAMWKKLPQIPERIRELEREVARLKQQLEGKDGQTA
ncbi:MAG TPA: UDP-3-O-(3-hydroxymyristoyl)glucosamine N-acyltransferase [Candidatus Brocadiia bacterium]|nr:UDP-3-O-(3-hydroxymyristoyl)glucosamine N-acyltransferase [Candidatus Brocadiia bacterium]